MQQEALDSDEIRLLMEVGMVLAGSGKTEPARRVFEALALIRPQRAFPHVGHAMALLNAGRAEDACRLLREAEAQVVDERPTVQAFLGLALQQAGRSAESQRLLEAAAQADPSIDGVGMARAMLGLDPAGDGRNARLLSSTPPEVK